MKKEIKKFYNNLKKELKDLNKNIKEITKRSNKSYIKIVLHMKNIKYLDLKMSLKIKEILM